MMTHYPLQLATIRQDMQRPGSTARGVSLRIVAEPAAGDVAGSGHAFRGSWGKYWFVLGLYKGDIGLMWQGWGGDPGAVPRDRAEGPAIPPEAFLHVLRAKMKCMFPLVALGKRGKGAKILEAFSSILSPVVDDFPLQEVCTRGVLGNWGPCLMRYYVKHDGKKWSRRAPALEEIPETIPGQGKRNGALLCMKV